MAYAYMCFVHVYVVCLSYVAFWKGIIHVVRNKLFMHPGHEEISPVSPFPTTAPGKPSPEYFDKALCMGKKPSLMDKYEYVTCGRVYKVDAVPNQMQRMCAPPPYQVPPCACG